MSQSEGEEGEGGVNSKKGCFGKKTKFLRESENFARNRDT